MDASGFLPASTGYENYPWFTVHEYDGQSPALGTEQAGLVHMGGREYDPVVGRFLTPDIVAPDGPGTAGWNRYAYARGNPTTNVDPTGYYVGFAGGGGGGGGSDPYGPFAGNGGEVSVGPPAADPFAGLASLGVIAPPTHHAQFVAYSGGIAHAFLRNSASAMFGFIDGVSGTGSLRPNMFAPATEQAWYWRGRIGGSIVHGAMDVVGIVGGVGMIGAGVGGGTVLTLGSGGVLVEVAVPAGAATVIAGVAVVSASGADLVRTGHRISEAADNLYYAEAAEAENAAKNRGPHQDIVEERLRRRAARREQQSRAENGQNPSGEGSRNHDDANRGPRGVRPTRPGTRNGRQRNVGIDEEHHITHDPHLGVR